MVPGSSRRKKLLKWFVEQQNKEQKQLQLAVLAYSSVPPPLVVALKSKTYTGVITRIGW